MSFKIYDAFRARKTFEALHATLQALRPKIRAAAEHLQLAAFAARLEQLADDPLIRFFEHGGPLPEHKGLYWQAMDAEHAAQDAVRTTGRRDPEADTDCSVLILPVEGGFLGRVFSEHAALRAIVLDVPEFEEFHYQTSTDRPETVTETDWEERRRLWEAATDGFSGAFSDHGFTYEMSRMELPLVAPQALAPRWQPARKRAEAVAKTLLLNRIGRELHTDADAVPTRFVSTLLQRFSEKTLEWQTLTEIVLPHIVPMPRALENS